MRNSRETVYWSTSKDGEGKYKSMGDLGAKAHRVSRCVFDYVDSAGLVRELRLYPAVRCGIVAKYGDGRRGNSSHYLRLEWRRLRAGHCHQRSAGVSTRPRTASRRGRLSAPRERRADARDTSSPSTARANPTPRPVSPRRGVRRSGTRMLRRMPSLPRQVRLAIPAPSPRRSTSTTSGCPGKAARAGLLAQLLPAFRKHA